MKRRIVFSAVLNQVQVGIVENSRLVEYYLERECKQRLVNNIYKGKVENILPGMGAAFVDIGLDRNAFLFLDDLPTPEDKERLRKGDSLLVQVAKEAEGTKGPRVKAQIALPGRYLVLLPYQTNTGISKQITDDEERNRLKEIAEEIAPQDMGVIVRTMAQGYSKEELSLDLDELLAEWALIQKKYKGKTPSRLLYQDYDLISRIIRDLYDPNYTEIIVDTPDLKGRVEQELEELGLDRLPQVELYQGKLNLFTYLGINKDLERACQERVWLDCGGYLVFNQTEALLSIDVNTGKYVGSTALQDTVLKTNLQAAEEIAHQLRLRNIGGIVIIDFIDMSESADKEAVLEQLSTSLGPDKTRTKLAGFTRLGLFELTRQKRKHTLAHMLETDCPHCQGTGRVSGDETVALQIAMEVKSLACEAEVEAILVHCHSAVAAQLIGPGGATLELLERQVGKAVFVRGDDSLVRQSYHLESGSEEQMSKKSHPVQVGERLTVHIVEPHATHHGNGLARVDGFVVECINCQTFVGQEVDVEITEVFRTSALARLIESKN